MMTEQQIRDFRYRGLRIPEHMIGAVLRYFNDHALPGDFLYAMLENDFLGAWRCMLTTRTARLCARGRVALQLGSHPTPTGVPRRSRRGSSMKQQPLFDIEPPFDIKTAMPCSFGTPWLDHWAPPIGSGKGCEKCDEWLATIDVRLGSKKRGHAN